MQKEISIADVAHKIPHMRTRPCGVVEMHYKCTDRTFAVQPLPMAQRATEITRSESRSRVPERSRQDYIGASWPSGTTLTPG